MAVSSYVLIRPADMARALEDRLALIGRFVARQEGADEVLLDALEEAGGEIFRRWAAARRAHDRSRRERALFWIGDGRIRQRVRIAGPWATQLRHGWRETTLTKRLRAALKRQVRIRVERGR